MGRISMAETGRKRFLGEWVNGFGESTGQASVVSVGADQVSGWQRCAGGDREGATRKPVVRRRRSPRRPAASRWLWMCFLCDQQTGRSLPFKSFFFFFFWISHLVCFWGQNQNHCREDILRMTSWGPIPKGLKRVILMVPCVVTKTYWQDWKRMVIKNFKLCSYYWTIPPLIDCKKIYRDDESLKLSCG